MPYPTITLEEHYLSTAIEENRGKSEGLYKGFPPQIHDRLKDLTPNGVRIKEMDSANVSVQVISHAPGAASSAPSVVKAANDELAQAVKNGPPRRLAGFAALPMGHPKEAADELERGVKDLGFLGALIDNHLDTGKGSNPYYDDERFWPVFAKAEELDVPVYIHPTFATEDMMDLLYKGNYPQKTAVQLSIAGWGWHEDTALHILRLYAAGLFDAHPRLKLIIGHMGEMLPFQLERIDGMTHTWDVRGKRGFKDVWDTNIYITTSGVWSVNPMRCLLQNTKVDHVLYSVDWPFTSNERGREWLGELEGSGLLKQEEVEMIAYGNAEKLLKIKARG